MVRLRDGESFPVRELPRRLLVVAVRKKATTARASAGVHKTSKGSGSSHPAMPPPPPSRMQPEGAAAAGDVTVEETDALDCGVCFLPLKPPIFQLKATGKCHVCGINTGGYSRCHAMEHIVESIRFPCPNAIHGCTARTTYYDQHFHCQTCPHRPCHCPSETCGFVGSTAALLDHFNEAHGWPCTTKVKAATMNYKDDDDYEFKLQLHDGFNFLLADCATADSKQGTIHGGLYLFLLNAVRQQR